MYTSAPAISSVFVSPVFLNVNKARLSQSSHRAFNLVTESAIGIISSKEPNLLLPTCASEGQRWHNLYKIYAVMITEWQSYNRSSLAIQKKKRRRDSIKIFTTWDSHHLGQQLSQSSHHSQQLRCKNHKGLQKTELHQFQSPLAVTKRRKYLTALYMTFFYRK